eukprot:5756393-Amphidinium_carterae.2
MRASDQRLHTQKGVKQGDPLSMHFYALVHEHIVAEIRAIAARMGVYLDGDFECGYVDDTCFGLTGQTASEVMARIATLSDVVISVFKKYGLDLNLGVGKTCVMPHLVGRGAKTVMSAMWSHEPDADGQKNAWLKLPSGIWLRVVRTYKHLGVMQSAPADMRSEVVRRCALTYAALRGIRRTLRSKKLTLAAKWGMANATV